MAEAVRILYDASTDVLRVFTTPEPVESIAVPGPSVTVLVSENLDRVVGIVFEHFASTMSANLSPASRDDPERLFREARGTIENLIPPLLESLAPQAKDRVAEWRELLGAR